jgi:hypothetical protein
VIDRPHGEAAPEPEAPELAERLLSERASPAAEFRGALGRHLGARDPGYGPRPPHLRARVALWMAAGAALAGVGALQALGVL